jgi:hypothetical protein
MATNQATPERENAADQNRLAAMKGAKLTSIRAMVNENEGVVVPLTEAEGKKVLALVRELYQARKPRR